MRDDQLESVERLLQQAQQLPASRRPAFLMGIADPLIRREVESLLASGAGDQSGIGSVVSEAAALTGQLAGRLIGHFRILRPLGHGAMGEVYRAEDSKLGRPVALKMLPLEFQHDGERVRWFEREARAAAALNHPNIITVHEIGESDGRIFIASELIEGETLAERLRGGSLSVAEASRIGSQIAHALAAAHAAGIVHRDLKPANIMLRRDGEVKVLDFGLARLSQPSGRVGEADETETQTVPGRIIGTLSYMSPEQARGEAADARSDLWSLGVVLYECLAGRRPFEGASHSEVIARILEGEARAVHSLNRAVPGRLSGLVGQLLTKDPGKRLGPTAEVARRLKQLAEFDAQRPARERRRRWTAAAAAAVLAIASVSGWLVHRWSKREWARYEAIPQARSLFDQGKNLVAYRLALDAERYIPNEPALTQLEGEISQSVTVHSEPAGAGVEWRPYADKQAAWQTLGRTPLEKSRIPAGAILLRVALSGY